MKSGRTPSWALVTQIGNEWSVFAPMSREDAKSEQARYRRLFPQGTIKAVQILHPNELAE